ncbi:hypothetical protein AB7360_12955 [Providencia alcalifaciens]|uniref:hypothetical protein n=1 Tax=Providencia alcalifaciens TaxID=126385 RepID=UPI0024AAC7DA|nr:hypothetical protein [Providencia rettgeri]
MNCTIRISAINIYRPFLISKNNCIVEECLSARRDNQRRINLHSKKSHIMFSSNKNALTMLINAAKPIIKDDDIDVLILASTMIKSFSSTQATVIHNKLNIKNNCLCIDVNTYCLEIQGVIDQAIMLLKSKSAYRKALVVFSDHLSSPVNSNKLLGSKLFRNTAIATAIILEKIEGRLSVSLADKWHYFDQNHYFHG